MKCKILRGLRILLSVAVLAAAGSRNEGLSLMVQQISLIGPRQWLGLMAGSTVAGAPVIAPLSDRIALSLAYGPGRASGNSTDNSA